MWFGFAEFVAWVCLMGVLTLCLPCLVVWCFVFLVGLVVSDSDLFSGICVILISWSFCLDRFDFICLLGLGCYLWICNCNLLLGLFGYVLVCLCCITVVCGFVLLVGYWLVVNWVVVGLFSFLGFIIVIAWFDFWVFCCL